MNYRKVTAVIRCDVVEKVEKALRDIGVAGMCLSQVEGYGEYKDFYARDMMCRHTRVEVFCRAKEAEGIAGVIMDAAHVGLAGDGIVAVLPTEHLYHIRTKAEIDSKGGTR